MARVKIEFLRCEEVSVISCPNCENPEFKHNLTNPSGNDSGFKIYCSCGLSTPKCDTQEKCIDIWNGFGKLLNHSGVKNVFRRKRKGNAQPGTRKKITPELIKKVHHLAGTGHTQQQIQKELRISAIRIGAILSGRITIDNYKMTYEKGWRNKLLNKSKLEDKGNPDKPEVRKTAKKTTRKKTAKKSR